MNLREALRRIRCISLDADPSPVEETVARELLPSCAAGAVLGSAEPGPVLTLRIEREYDPGYAWSVDAGGNMLCTATRGSLLFAAAQRATGEWADRPVEQFRAGNRHPVAFHWLRNLSDFLVGSVRDAEGFDREAYCRQVAAQGYTHLTINGLGAPRAHESGPPGDVYHWFYEYSPDLDQFVDSRLLRGYYPADYLAANLRALRQHADWAVRYGLTPGLHINSPRSMPEEFWRRYGFLRGARVDHPRETLQPRYTLALAHPAVQEHYRELVRAILREVPEIGFIHLWTNDSGGGFEFVSSLYAGRNGGPYLLREWKSHREIADKAGENVLTYLHLLRDEGRRINPHFRVIFDLGSFTDERTIIIDGMGGGIDAGAFGFFLAGSGDGDDARLRRVGADTHARVDTGDTNVPGVPYPRLVHERLRRLHDQNVGYVLAGSTPASLAPYDINQEVLRAFQLSPERPLDDVLAWWSRHWAGESHSAGLRELWDLADRAVRGVPLDVPFSTFAFPWFRLWVRPFVPDIDAIPETDRRYYEPFMIATFNNPARIDLNNDMLWNFLSPEQAGEKRERFDADVLPPLTDALERSTGLSEGPPVFRDLHQRLRAARCFYRTLRNSMAWTESVHGYLQAGTGPARRRCRDLCASMVNDELANTRDLLDLWRNHTVWFLPVAAGEESPHSYGRNFGELLQKKIMLMERYGDLEPRVDPAYLWRMHEPVSDH